MRMALLRTTGTIQSAVTRCLDLSHQRYEYHVHSEVYLSCILM